MTRPRSVLAALAFVATVLAGGCSSDVAPTSSGGMADTTLAARFNHMGDSVIAAGGSASDAAPFYGAAGLAGLSSAVATVSVSIDGTPTTLSAIASAVEISGGPMIACPVPLTEPTAAAPFLCPWGIPRVTRTIFAWDPAKPARIVTLVATVDSGPIGTPTPVVVVGSGGRSTIGVGTTALIDSGTGTAAAVLRPIPAHLEYADGTGSVWWGISGTQRNTVMPNGKPCPPPPTAAKEAPRPGVIPASVCGLADFTFSFNGKVAAPPIAFPRNAATGTHTVSLGAASLTGIYFRLALYGAAPDN